MKGENMKITLLEYPTGKDWVEVKRRALVTIGNAQSLTACLCRCANTTAVSATK